MHFVIQPLFHTFQSVQIESIWNAHNKSMEILLNETWFLLEEEKIKKKNFQVYFIEFIE